MRNIISLIIVVLFTISLQAQTTDSIVNVREHGDQHLLSEPFQDSCMLLDVYEYTDPSENEWGNNAEFSEYWQQNSGCGSGVSLLYSLQYMADIAQPFYTDSTLEIIGVAVFSPARYYMGRNALICIADSNLNVLRTTPMYDTPIPWDMCENIWLNYDEFFFDSSVYVKDTFYVIWDNPKPDSAHNWRNIVNDLEHNPSQLMHAYVFAATQNLNPYVSQTECSATMLPLIKRYGITDSTLTITDTIVLVNLFTDINATLCTELSDTAWREVTTETYNYSISWKHKKVYAYYMFPIFAVHNDSIADSSSDESIAVDNYTFVFPNPTSANVTVQCSFRIKTIEVYNSLGQKVEEFTVDGYNKSINTEKYPKGNYILKIITESGTTDKKLVVQ
ncbi:MAG: T9SS type A sorting domain-containing protein [Bacteroidales bacterium]|nr:T9SS type A sorting domain-containing protein [Bacteroidales bacterium]